MSSISCHKEGEKPTGIVYESIVRKMVVENLESCSHFWKNYFNEIMMISTSYYKKFSSKDV